jgi:hypothetical protein
MFTDFRKNPRPMIGTVIAATVLWFIVTTDKEYVHDIEVPFEIVRLAPGKTLSEPVPEKVLLEVRGRGRSLIALNFYNAAIRLDLPSVGRPQVIDLHDYISFFDIPATLGIRVSEVLDPVEVNLAVDDIVTRRIPVALSGNVATMDGYALLKFWFDDDSVTVTGPAKRVNRMSRVMTENLDEQDHRFSFNKRVNLESPLPGLITVEPRRTRANFDIQRLAERIVYDIPVSVINVPAGLEVKAEPANMALRIKGGEKLVAAVKAEEIVAQIDYSLHQQGANRSYAPFIRTPENITWVESIPREFSLYIKRKQD